MLALEDRFRQWARDPARNILNPAAFPQTSEGAQAMIEEAMWIAFSEGYEMCRSDVRSALERLHPPG